MIHLLIDGYNLLAAREGGLGLPPEDLERQREKLLEALARYARARAARITVVFDAHRGPHLTRTCERWRGLELIYTAQGRLADDVLRELFRQRGARWVVVSSDRAVAGFVRASGGEAVDAHDFSERLEFALYADLKGVAGGEEEEAPRAAAGTKKKGPARRASKQERRRAARLRKL